MLDNKNILSIDNNNLSENFFLNEFTYNELLNIGSHIGEGLEHRIWHEENRYFIYGRFRRNIILDVSISIINLRASLILMEEFSLKGLAAIVSSQHPLMSIRLKSEMDEFVEYGLYYVHRRWVGGIISNFKTLARYVFPYLYESFQLGYSLHSRIYKRWRKLIKIFCGLRGAKMLPSFSVGTSLKYNPWIVRESYSINIPHASLVDSDSIFSSLITYAIPCSESSLHSTLFYLVVFKNSYFLGILKKRSVFLNFLNVSLSLMRINKLSFYLSTLTKVIKFVEVLSFFLFLLLSKIYN